MGDESTTDSVRNQADNEFRIRYNGGIRLRVSTAANGNTPGAGGNVGCDLTVAVPSWTCASSRTVKERFLPVDVDDVLERLLAVPVSTWSMIGTDGTVRHMGPVAEDFYAAFPIGLGETTIGLGDIDGVNMAAIQGLARRLEAATAEVRTLQAERDGLEARVRRLEDLLLGKP
jgi:trimeric autotransporter adhesin